MSKVTISVKKSLDIKREYLEEYKKKIKEYGIDDIRIYQKLKKYGYFDDKGNWKKI